jgi:hypothetical protein
MSIDRTSTVITAAGFTGADQHEVVLHVLPDSERAGCAWALDRILELNQAWKGKGLGGFVIDSKGQASDLIEDLQSKGVRVFTPSSLEYARASAEFAIGVTGTKSAKPYIAHIGDPMLTAAVAGAGKRKLSGLWAFARGHEQTNIVPLESAVLGVWGLQRALRESKIALPTFKRLGG